MLKKIIDITLFKILAGFYTLVIVLGFLKRIYFDYHRYTPYEETESYLWLKIIFHYYILDWIFVMIFMTIIAYTSKKMLKTKSLKFVIVSHVFFSFIIGWFIYILASITLYFTGQISMENAINNISFKHIMQNVVANFLTYFSMLGIIYLYYYIKKLETTEQQKINLATQLTEIKMKILTDRLHPHFLFNTLNTISTLIDVNKKKAQNVIVDLSDLLREIIELKEDNLITLSQELNLLNKYLDIKSIRFYDHLKIKTNVQENINDALIPNMLIQPIIENSFKHGYSFNHTNLEIELNIYKKDEQLIIEIKNDGKSFETSIAQLKIRGVGLKNTINRLKTLYGKNYKFSMTNNENNKGVITQIIIPFELAEAKLYSF